MTSTTSSPSANELLLEPGRMVRTPMGHFAVIRSVHLLGDHVEVLVEYAEGERAKFRACHLRPLP